MPNDASAQLLQQQLLQQQLLMQNTQNQDDEIDLAELWRAIWAGKFTIIIIPIICFYWITADTIFNLLFPVYYEYVFLLLLHERLTLRYQT